MGDASRRRLILEAAGRLLRHYGPSKTTVADVAKEAGVGVGSVYLEFSSKEAIVEELSRAQHEGVLAAMRAAASPGPSCSARLAAVFEARLHHHLTILEEGAHACELVHCGSSPVKAAQSGFLEAERTLVLELLAAGAATGELEVGDPGHTADVVLRAYGSFCLPWVRGCDRSEAQRAIKTMHRLITDGLRRR